MRGQKRVLEGVHARLRRAMDAREPAYDPRIHLLRKVLAKMMDCRVKPGNDAISGAINGQNLRLLSRAERDHRGARAPLPRASGESGTGGAAKLRRGQG